MLYTNYVPTPTPDMRQEIIGATDQTLKDAKDGITLNYVLPETPNATILNTGLVRALVSDPKANYTKYPYMALAIGSFSHVTWVAYHGSNRVATHVATSATSNVPLAGTISDGADADGFARNILTASGATYPRRNISTFTIQIQPQFGMYLAFKFKFPTTANQTALTDRVARWGFYSTVPTSNADPGGDFCEIVFDEDGLGSGLYLRTRDNATTSQTAIGVTPALDTLYVCELWTLDGTKVYARVNGTTISKTTNLPTTTTSLNVNEYLIGMVTDQGDAVLKSYNLMIASM